MAGPPPVTTTNGGGGLPANSGPPPFDFSSLPTDDLGPSIRAGIWILFALATVFIALRIYCKTMKHSRLYWDDAVLIAAWVAVLGDAIATTVAINLGFGKHIWAVDMANTNPLALSGLISVTFSIAGQSWSKVSFALTLLRISTGWQRYFLWIAIVIMNILFGLGALFFWINCTPLETAWKPTTPGVCWNPWININYGIVISAFSGVMDLCFAFLPWNIIMGLQMKKKEKFGVAIALSMGVFAAVCAFIKCSHLPSMASGDFTYAGSNLVIWGHAEGCVCIMAASIPVLRVLVKEVATMRRYYLSNDDPNKKGSNGSHNYDSAFHRSTSNAVVSTHRSGHNAVGRTKPARSDDLSDKSILESPSTPPHVPGNRILQTNEVNIRYGSRGSDKNAQMYEMERV